MGQEADSDSNNKDIDAEDVGATLLCGQPAAMDSACTPNATSLMKRWNQSIPNTRNQAKSSSLGGGAYFDSVCTVSDSVCKPQLQWKDP